jgi:hypothetical protein
MVHFKPGFHARSSQFIWHFDLDCSWDSIEGLPCIQPDILKRKLNKTCFNLDTTLEIS